MWQTTQVEKKKKGSQSHRTRRFCLQVATKRLKRHPQRGVLPVWNSTMVAITINQKVVARPSSDIAARNEGVTFDRTAPLNNFIATRKVYKFDQGLICAPCSACAQCLIASDWANLHVFDSFAAFHRRDKLLQHLSLTGGGARTSLGEDVRLISARWSNGDKSPACA